MQINDANGTITSTVGGTLLVVLVQITGGELLKTVILAGVGASVSFIVSMVMKRLFLKKRVKEEKDPC